MNYIIWKILNYIYFVLTSVIQKWWNMKTYSEALFLIFCHAAENNWEYLGNERNAFCSFRCLNLFYAMSRLETKLNKLDKNLWMWTLWHWQCWCRMSMFFLFLWLFPFGMLYHNHSIKLYFHKLYHVKTEKFCL